MTIQFIRGEVVFYKIISFSTSGSINGGSTMTYSDGIQATADIEFVEDSFAQFWDDASGGFWKN